MAKFWTIICMYALPVPVSPYTYTFLRIPERVQNTHSVGVHTAQYLHGANWNFPHIFFVVSGGNENALFGCFVHTCCCCANAHCSADHKTQWWVCTITLRCIMYVVYTRIMYSRSGRCWVSFYVLLYVHSKTYYDKQKSRHRPVRMQTQYTELNGWLFCRQKNVEIAPG